MITVILAGGKSLRMSEYPEPVPKPLVKIGDRTLLWHLMNIYAQQGYVHFVIAAGHRWEAIVNWVAETKLPWQVEVVNTGPETPTAGRIRKIADLGFLDNPFFATYADGLANVNLSQLLSWHRKKKCFATVTAVRPRIQFGVMRMNDEGLVDGFEEKPISRQHVNGGFFVFEPEALRFFHEDSDLEQEVLPFLASLRQLNAYKHEGFWRQCDHMKDVLELEQACKEKAWAVGASRS